MEETYKLDDVDALLEELKEPSRRTRWKDS